MSNFWLTAFTRIIPVARIWVRISPNFHICVDHLSQRIVIFKRLVRWSNTFHCWFYFLSGWLFRLIFRFYPVILRHASIFFTIPGVNMWSFSMSPLIKPFYSLLLPSILNHLGFVLLVRAKMQVLFSSVRVYRYRPYLLLFCVILIFVLQIHSKILSINIIEYVYL